MYIPNGYGTVFPYFFVDRGDEFIQFLVGVFGAVELGRTQTPDGRLANARVRIGNANFMISEADGEHFQAMHAAYYIYVEDVAAVLAKAVAFGANKLFDPMDMPYGDRQAGITDPFGNIWWLSHRLVPTDYSDD
jgi:uncharacterized glyoxalase superfamily protein PhnB